VTGAARLRAEKTVDQIGLQPHFRRKRPTQWAQARRHLIDFLLEKHGARPGDPDSGKNA
jgi:hypothetical protein